MLQGSVCECNSKGSSEWEYFYFLFRCIGCAGFIRDEGLKISLQKKFISNCNHIILFCMKVTILSEYLTKIS